MVPYHLPHLYQRSATHLWTNHCPSRTLGRIIDVLQMYITMIFHLVRSSSVQVTLLIESVARDDFLEANRQREVWKCVNVLTSRVPENNSSVPLTGCAE